jgi:hypothetical protein
MSEHLCEFRDKLCEVLGRELVLQDQIKQLRAENERLRAALKPARNRLEHDYCDEGMWLDPAALEIVKYADAALGDYCADYSELPTKEIGMRNPELDKLLNESKIVSTKR